MQREKPFGLIVANLFIIFSLIPVASGADSMKRPLKDYTLERAAQFAKKFGDQGYW